MKKTTIGWYCPFTLPPLCKFDIELIRAPYENHEHGNLGSVKLCKKMTLVRGMTRAGAIDGMVMADCCNLSQAVYDSLVDENPELSIFYMKIPKVGDFWFNEILSKEWIRLEQWLNRFNTGNINQEQRQNPALEVKFLEQSTKAGIQAIHTKNAVWCRLLVEDGQKMDLTRKNIADFLIHHVHCVKFVKNGIFDDASRIKQEEYRTFMNNFDFECVNQSYYACLLSGAAKRGV